MTHALLSWWRSMCLAWVLLLGGGLTVQAAPTTYAVVALHDVVDSVQELDTDSITSDNLVAFFDWLKGNGWHPVSLDDIEQAQSGRKPLPDKAILLTFDDGYASLYTRVYPLALAYRYPVVAALVGAWMDGDAEALVDYGTQKVPRSHFITWSQAREMQASGLVEFASHSYQLHESVQATVQGNMLPAAIALRHDDAGPIESASAQLSRIRADLARSRAQLQAELGRAPRVLVWPFGRYGALGLQAARDVGFSFAFTLHAAPAEIAKPMEVARYWPAHHPKLSDLVSLIATPAKPSRVQRLVCVDPQALWSDDPAVFDSRLGQAIERLRTLGATAAVVHALGGTDSGGAVQAWFAAPGMAVRADALTRIGWQIRTRADVDVIARMPHAPLRAAGLSEPAIEAAFAALGAQLPWNGLLLEEGNTPDAGARAYRAAQANSPEMRLLWRAPGGEPGAPPPIPPAGTDLALYSPAQMASLIASKADLYRARLPTLGLWLEDGTPLAADALGAATRAFQIQGGTAVGWCPDDVLGNQPDASRAAPYVSSATHPVKF